MPLTPEQRNDLRKRVLMGQQLTLEESREVIESLRQGAGVAVLAGENRPKRGKKAPGISDETLEKELADLGL